MNASQRTALYALCGAIAAAAVVWQILTAEEAAALLGIAGAAIGVVGSFVAVRHVTPDDYDTVPVEDVEVE